MNRNVWKVKLDGWGEPVVWLVVDGEPVEAFGFDPVEGGSWSSVLDLIQNFDVRPEWLQEV